MNAESFPQVGYLLRDSVDNVGNFIANDELNILNNQRSTRAAISSPIKSPSLILIGPGKN